MQGASIGFGKDFSDCGDALTRYYQRPWGHRSPSQVHFPAAVSGRTVVPQSTRHPQVVSVGLIGGPQNPAVRPESLIRTRTSDGHPAQMRARSVAVASSALAHASHFAAPAIAAHGFMQ